MNDDAVQLAQEMFQMCRDGDERLLPLLRLGAPHNMQDSAGNTMLMLAAYHGHEHLVRALCNGDADVDLPNDRGQTPLAGAVFKGYDDVVATLLEFGADPDAGTPSARAAAQMFGREYSGLS